ncbi:MAG: hypothetical protein AAGB00_03465 [Planctomycetota bacterium]
MVCVAAFSGVTGCGTAPLEQQLLGEWVGSPDSAAARESRTPSKLTQLTGRATDGANAAGEKAAEEEITAAADPVNAESPHPAAAEATDLDAFDFRITLNLRPRGELRMSLSGGAALAGSWQVLVQEGATGVLELVSKPEGAVAQQRRFEVAMDPNGAGFTLREEGADPRFGWLYFRRPEAAEPAPAD